MVWAVCEDLGVDFAHAVVLYQSTYFADIFPEENKRFGNVEYIDAVPNDLEASLLRMREAMLSRPDLAAAVFIGGMEGSWRNTRCSRDSTGKPKFSQCPHPVERRVN